MSLQDLARGMRSKPTPPEALMWKCLKTKPSGYSFEQQRVSGPYILDFYCAELNLGIEVDGLIHVGREAKDLQRSDWLLNNLGIKLLRFPAADCFNKSAMKRVRISLKALRHPEKAKPKRGKRWTAKPREDRRYKPAKTDNPLFNYARGGSPYSSR